MLRVPVGLRPVPRVHQVLKGEAVQLSFTTEQPDNVPTEAIDIDPAASDPVLPWLGKELPQRIVVQLILLDPIG